MKTSKKLFPWRIDLQNASPAEYSKILEARRLELLDVLDTGNFTGEFCT